MNDNQQIPDSLKKYAEATGLSLDHNFLLTYSRYKINLLLGFFGFGFSLVSLAVLLTGSTEFIIGYVIASIVITAFISICWAFFTGIRLLYTKTNWFPIQSEKKQFSIDYVSIRDIQAQNLRCETVRKIV